MHQRNHGWLHKLVFFAAALIVQQPRSASADEIKYLAQPQQALAGFTSLIENARSSIDIATFIFEPCQASTQALIDRLIEKARQGVKVRIVLDAFTQSEEQKQNLAALFAREGIELRLFNTNFFEINFRMHSKFMITDREFLLAGGRNIADQYFAVSSRLNYVDRDILARGPMGEEAAAALDLLWNSDKVSPAPRGDRFVPWPSFCGEDVSSKRQAIETYLAKNGESVLSRTPTRSCSNAHFWVDDPDFGNPSWGPAWNDGQGAPSFLSPERMKRKHSTRQVLSFIKNARKRLLLENENYLPITGLERSLVKARSKGVSISVLSNQDMDEGPQFFLDIIEYQYVKLAARDNIGSQWVGLVSSYGTLKASYEITPPRVRTFLHGKVGVRDDRDVLVGSFNLDSRSENINLETAIIIPNCPALAEDVKKGIKDVYRAYKTDLSSGQIPAKRPPSLLTMILGDLLLPQL